jgi:sugar-specific transcriptional regulator TrmB
MRELLKNVKSLPDVEVCQTPEEFNECAERTLASREKVIYYAGSVEFLLEAYDQAYEDSYYIPTRMERGILVKILAPDTPAMRRYQSKDSEEVRETRCLPADVAMDYSVMIHDDTVVFFARDEQLYGLSVVSPSIAQTMKVMFNEMWRHAT